MSGSQDPFSSLPQGLSESAVGEREEKGSTDVRKAVEDIVFGFLDGGGSARETWDEYYMTETVDVLEDELRLEHPENVAFLEYPDGQQMVYDAITQLFDYSGLYEKAEEIEEEVDESVPLWKLPVELAKLARYIPTYLWMRKKMNFQADRVMGLHEVNRYTVSGFPATLEDEIIGYVPENIMDFADRQDIEPEEADQYVKTHEGIHVIQSHSFPQIQRRRRDVLERGLDIENSETVEDFKEEIQAVMTAIEGHAEFFTNKVAEERYALEIGRDLSLKQDIIYRIFGMKEKREQYRKGSELIGQLYDLGGPELAHEPLRNPPERLEELEDLDRWT